MAPGPNGLTADAVERVRVAVASGSPDDARLLLHPYLHWTTGTTTIRGRSRVLAALADSDELAPPSAVELRDGQIYRWTA